MCPKDGCHVVEIGGRLDILRYRASWLFDPKTVGPDVVYISTCPLIAGTGPITHARRVSRLPIAIVGTQCVSKLDPGLFKIRVTQYLQCKHALVNKIGHFGTHVRLVRSGVHHVLQVLGIGVHPPVHHQTVRSRNQEIIVQHAVLAHLLVGFCRFQVTVSHMTGIVPQRKYRLEDISGISISGRCVLFFDNSADRIAAVKVNQNRRRGKVSLSMEGYARVGARYHEDSGSHGSMAMSGGKVALSNEVDHNCWLFDIESVCSDARLDKRDGNRRLFFGERHGDDDEDAATRQQLARQLALGKVEFPPFAGFPPKRKKRRLGAFESGGFSLESNEVPDDDIGFWITDRDDGQGNGGPVAHAMYGKWLVAGYLNGSIVRAPLLPDEFDVPPEKMGGTNGVVSCSRLPSDEWFCPVLQAHVDSGDDDDDDDDDVDSDDDDDDDDDE